MTQRSSRKREVISNDQVSAILHEYRQSGLTQVKFCQDRQIPLWRLHRWLLLERRGRLAAKTATPLPELIRVTLPEQSSCGGSGWAYELDWQRHQLRFGRHFEASEVRQLLELLRVC